MDDKPLEQTGIPQKKKIEPTKKSFEAPPGLQKQPTVEQGAFQKLHQASIFAEPAELAGRALEQLARAKNDATLSLAGFKASDIVNKLPSDVVESLARGKQLHDATNANPSVKLNASEQEMLAKYTQYHDKIVNDGLNQNSTSAVLIDHKVMIDELNESIAARYKSERESQHQSRSQSSENVDVSKVTARNTKSQPNSEKSPSVDNDGNRESAHSPRSEKQASSKISHLANNETSAGQSANVKPELSSEPGKSSHLTPKAQPELEGLSGSKNNNEIANNLGAKKENDFVGKEASKIAGKTESRTDSQIENRAESHTDKSAERLVGKENAGRLPHDSLTPAEIARKPSGSEEKQSAVSTSTSILNATNESQASLRKNPSIDETSHSPRQAAIGKLDDAAGKVNLAPTLGTRINSSLSTKSNPHEVDSAAGSEKVQANPIYPVHPICNEGNQNLHPPVVNGRALNVEPEKFSPKENAVHFHTPQSAPTAGLRGGLENFKQPNGELKGNFEALILPVTTKSKLPGGDRTALKIDDARRLVQTLKDGALYMVRPLTVSSEPNETHSKIVLAVRSSLIASLKTPTPDALTQDLQSKQSTPFKDSAHQTIQRDLAAKTNRLTTFTVVNSQGLKLTQPVDSRANSRSVGAAITSDDESKKVITRSPRAIFEPKRNVLGAEIALTMILASAGIQRVRAEQVKPVPGINDRNLDSAKNPFTSSVSDKRTAHERVIEKLRLTSLVSKVETVAAKSISTRVNENPHRFIVQDCKHPLKIQASLGTSLTQVDSRPIDRNTRTGAETRHTFGTEIALVALLSAGGISRQKVDRQPEPVGGASFKVLNLTDRPEPTRKNGLANENNSGAKFQNTASLAQQHGRGADERTEKQSDLIVRIKESLPCPEHLKNQLDSLFKRLMNVSVPVYAVVAGDQKTSETFSRASRRKDELPDETEEPGRVSGIPDRTYISSESFKHAEHNSTKIESNKIQLQRPTVLIALDDTLISIAETFFHDPNLAWLIAALNVQNTRQVQLDGRLVITLMTRQRLVLPLFKPDIVDFYSRRTSERPIEELVTVVEETQIDRELVSSVLDSVVGESRKKETRKKKQLDTKSSTDFDGTQLIFDD